jgi:hypothetical protein
MTNLSVRLAHSSEPLIVSSPVQKGVHVAPQSFMEELSRTVAEARLKSGTSTTSRDASAGSKSSQINVGRQNSGAASSATSGLNALVPKATASVVAAASSGPATNSVAAAEDGTQAADAAYWAQQPAAVQQLQNIGDYSQRQELAAQLASQGYAIDVPVMVWGWDPSATTQLRQGFGYTWVPSAMQSPVTAAPGISGGGIVPYDPSNPPAGSISV